MSCPKVENQPPFPKKHLLVRRKSRQNQYGECYGEAAKEILGQRLLVVETDMLHIARHMKKAGFPLKVRLLYRWYTIGGSNPGHPD